MHTKRSLLSETSRIFDPLGWLSLVSVRVKIFFQQLLLHIISRDDELPGDIATNWSLIWFNLIILVFQDG